MSTAPNRSIEEIERDTSALSAAHQSAITTFVTVVDEDGDAATSFAHADSQPLLTEVAPAAAASAVAAGSGGVNINSVAEAAAHDHVEEEMATEGSSSHVVSVRGEADAARALAVTSRASELAVLQLLREETAGRIDIEAAEERFRPTVTADGDTDPHAITGEAALERWAQQTFQRQRAAILASPPFEGLVTREFLRRELWLDFTLKSIAALLLKEEVARRAIVEDGRHGLAPFARWRLQLDTVVVQGTEGTAIRAEETERVARAAMRAEEEAAFVEIFGFSVLTPPPTTPPMPSTQRCSSSADAAAVDSTAEIVSPSSNALEGEEALDESQGRNVSEGGPEAVVGALAKHEGAEAIERSECEAAAAAEEGEEAHSSDNDANTAAVAPSTSITAAESTPMAAKAEKSADASVAAAGKEESQTLPTTFAVATNLVALPTAVSTTVGEPAIIAPTSLFFLERAAAEERYTARRAAEAEAATDLCEDALRTTSGGLRHETAEAQELTWALLMEEEAKARDAVVRLVAWRLVTAECDGRYAIEAAEAAAWGAAGGGGGNGSGGDGDHISALVGASTEEPTEFLLLREYCRSGLLPFSALAEGISSASAAASPFASRPATRAADQPLSQHHATTSFFSSSFGGGGDNGDNRPISRLAASRLSSRAGVVSRGGGGGRPLLLAERAGRIVRLDAEEERRRIEAEDEEERALLLKLQQHSMPLPEGTRGRLLLPPVGGGVTNNSVAGDAVVARDIASSQQQQQCPPTPDPSDLHSNSRRSSLSRIAGSSIAASSAATSPVTSALPALPRRASNATIGGKSAGTSILHRNLAAAAAAAAEVSSFAVSSTVLAAALASLLAVPPQLRRPVAKPNMAAVDALIAAEEAKNNKGINNTNNHGPSQYRPHHLLPLLSTSSANSVGGSHHGKKKATSKIPSIDGNAYAHSNRDDDADGVMKSPADISLASHAAYGSTIDPLLIRRLHAATAADIEGRARTAAATARQRQQQTGGGGGGGRGTSALVVEGGEEGYTYKAPATAPTPTASIMSAAAAAAAQQQRQQQQLLFPPIRFGDTGHQWAERQPLYRSVGGGCGGDEAAEPPHLAAAAADALTAAASTRGAVKKGSRSGLPSAAVTPAAAKDAPDATIIAGALAAAVEGVEQRDEEERETAAEDNGLVDFMAGATADLAAAGVNVDDVEALRQFVADGWASLDA